MDVTCRNGSRTLHSIAADSSSTGLQPACLSMTLLDSLLKPSILRSVLLSCAELRERRTTGCPSCKTLWTRIKALNVCTSSDKMGCTRRPVHIDSDEW